MEKLVKRRRLQQKRQTWDIYADVLTLIQTPKTRYRIMYRCNLSWSLTKQVVNTFLEKGLIEIKSGSPSTYAATRKGRAWLRAYHRLTEQLLPSAKLTTMNGYFKR